MKSEIVLTEKDLPAEVIRAIEKGSKVEAIKLLREKQGLGLANAKVLVDRAAARRAPARVSGDAIASRERGKRAVVKTLFLLSLLAAAFYLYTVV